MQITKKDGIYANERALMVTRQIKARGIKDAKILKVMETIPRHKFVPEEYQQYSYRDEPLSIGFGQTISQPYIVAFMTEVLMLDNDDVVLEIGTGSGYQAAVLSLLVKQVYSIEIIDELGLQTADKLKNMGYGNVEIKICDGYNGWNEHAPYDAIVVTAAPDHIPPDLIKQLKIGGKIAIPIGEVNSVQTLKLGTKDKNGTIELKNVLPVMFVPLTR